MSFCVVAWRTKVVVASIIYYTTTTATIKNFLLYFYLFFFIILLLLLFIWWLLMMMMLFLLFFFFFFFYDNLTIGRWRSRWAWRQPCVARCPATSWQIGFGHFHLCLYHSTSWNLRQNGARPPLCIFSWLPMRSAAVAARWLCPVTKERCFSFVAVSVYVVIALKTVCRFVL